MGMSKGILLWLAVVSVGLLLVGVSAQNQFIKVDTRNQQLVDQYGRQRIFHGVNVVYKEFPWHPSNGTFDPQLSLNDEDIQNLVEWGFNFVRLGVMWPGVEPSRNEVNQTYLEVMSNFVDKLYANGIYVLIDFHQDLISRFYCGEGIPDWVVVNSTSWGQFPMPITDSPYPTEPNGYPALSTCLQKEFATYYFSHSVGLEFQALYDNSSDLQNRFAYYWSNVSATFASNPGVIGYELINEPWPGDIYGDPRLLVDRGYADRVNLAPLYERLNSVIRANDNDHIIFFERTLADLLGGIGLETGPGGPDYKDRQVYSYHIYCAPKNSSGDPGNIAVCIAEDYFFFDTDISDWRRLGCGAFMTEFGAVDDAKIAVEMLTDLTSIADSLSHSWAYWAFKDFHDITTSSQLESFYDTDGNLEIPKVKALSRTYPRAVAGEIVTYKFAPETSTFTLVYFTNTTITEPTEIYLNENWYYPNGYSVDLMPESALSWTSPSTNLVWVTPTPTTNSGVEVQVTITAK
eukprot:TRINITY_DN2266_c0_g1_i1.p1 TRINITY_DN2266_c0_g1~~TRINITY_DN2266_c0_g1_i1.p1  ORF type:complete len:535 (-),score=83.50 TRINITY_DN2266_c0_g1_i1:97-1647(-)